MFTKLKKSVTSSVKPSIKTVVWLLKLMLPITLLVAILDYMGIILAISNFVEPMFTLMGLTGDAAIVFITSSVASFYAAIGVMASFGFDLREVTIMATMCMICHNLIIETKIQQKAGSPWWYIVFIRVFFGLLSGYLLNLVLPAQLPGTLFMPEMVVKPSNWGEVFICWAETILPLTTKMLIFVMLLNVIQGILREFDLIDKIIGPLRPFMLVLAVPYSATFLWIVANTLGLAYGGMIMAEEIDKGLITNREAKMFNTSVALNHSVFEDTLLFMTLGVSGFWALFPRVIVAIVVTWSQKVFYMIKDKKVAKV